MALALIAEPDGGGMRIKPHAPWASHSQKTYYGIRNWPCVRFLLRADAFAMNDLPLVPGSSGDLSNLRHSVPGFLRNG